ncbi:MAG: hypothetical protein R3274_02105 [Desulfobacterales bacterium]|nr:hypothetical protein [Desulfobacterales bacterium]
MERRIHQRYGVKPGTFAVLRSTSIELSKIKDMSMGEIAFAVIKSKPIKMGQIIDISTEGLAFHYIDRQGASNSLYKMDILFAQDAFYLDRLLFKPVFDIEVKTDIPLNSFAIRKCGVKFGELNQRQRSQLAYFICNHTLGSEDVKTTRQPWYDERLMLCNPNEMVESLA